MCDPKDIKNDMISLRNLALRNCMRLAKNNKVKVLFSVEAYGRTLIFSSEEDHLRHLKRISNSKRLLKFFENKDYKQIKIKNKRRKKRNEFGEELFVIAKEPDLTIFKTPETEKLQRKMDKKFWKFCVDKVNEAIPDSYVEPEILAAIHRKYPGPYTEDSDDSLPEEINCQPEKRKVNKLFHTYKEENATQALPCAENEINFKSRHSENVDSSFTFNNKNTNQKFASASASNNINNFNNNFNFTNNNYSSESNDFEESEQPEISIRNSYIPPEQINYMDQHQYINSYSNNVPNENFNRNYAGYTDFPQRGQVDDSSKYSKYSKFSVAQNEPSSSLMKPKFSDSQNIFKDYLRRKTLREEHRQLQTSPMGSSMSMKSLLRANYLSNYLIEDACKKI